MAFRQDVCCRLPGFTFPSTPWMLKSTPVNYPHVTADKRFHVTSLRSVATVFALLTNI
jgi:hypothetical protein